jgi:sugar-specific transcriptional regulator TrmB
MTLKNTTIKNKIKSVEKNPLIEKLVTFGFSRIEASIYMYLLQKGIETGGSKIALGAGFHRQYVYLALPKLVEQGLVEEIPHGKQSKYKARTPQVIETLGRKKALIAGDLARELNLISSIGNEQDFEVLQGKRAIQEYELQYANRADFEEEEYIIGGASSSYAELMDEVLDEYLLIKEKSKIRVKYLGTVDERPFYDDYIGKFENQEYRFMQKLPKGKTHMLIRKDSVSFFSFLNPPLVYIVKSTVIAENYKQFFMMLWEMANE